MLALTENAANAIRGIVESSDAIEAGGLRFSLESVNADEAELQVALAPGAEPGDEEVEESGAFVFLDPEAAAILEDKILDARVYDDGEIGFSLEDRADKGLLDDLRSDPPPGDPSLN